MRRTAAALALAAVLAGWPASAAQDDAAAIDALVARARTALAAGRLVTANHEAEGAYHLAAAALETAGAAAAPRIRTALGDAIETRAAIMVEDGARAEAVRFLRVELDTHRRSSIATRLESAIAHTSLETRPAPAIEGRLHLGPGVPSMDQLRGKAVLLFFWAHWCGQCRADSPLVARLSAKYRAAGLVLLAPTQRYGSVDDSPAAPARELRRITAVRDEHYPFLRDIPVPISDAVYKAYGVTTIPMYVLIDRDGVVRLYHAGRMTEAALDAAISGVL